MSPGEYTQIHNKKIGCQTLVFCRSFTGECLFVRRFKPSLRFAKIPAIYSQSTLENGDVVYYVLHTAGATTNGFI